MKFYQEKVLFKKESRDNKLNDVNFNSYSLFYGNQQFTCTAI